MTSYVRINHQAPGPFGRTEDHRLFCTLTSGPSVHHRFPLPASRFPYFYRHPPIPLPLDFDGCLPRAIGQLSSPDVANRVVIERGAMQPLAKEPFEVHPAHFLGNLEKVRFCHMLQLPALVVLTQDATHRVMTDYVS